jgi:archaellum component FlaC
MDKIIESLIPQMMARFDRLSDELGAVRNDLSREASSLRGEIEALRQDMIDRFERTHELLNELGLRINTTETKVDTISEFAYGDANDIRDRLARVEEVHKMIRPAPSLRLVSGDEPLATSRRKSSRKAR